MADMLAFAATYSTPTFNSFLYPVLVGLGITLAAICIALIINGFIGGISWLYQELRNTYLWKSGKFREHSYDAETNRFD